MECIVDEYCKIKLSINCNDFVYSCCCYNGILLVVGEVLRKFSSLQQQKKIKELKSVN